MFQAPLQATGGPHASGSGEDSPYPVSHKETGHTISMSNRVEEHLVVGRILPQAPPPEKHLASPSVTADKKTVAANIRSIRLQNRVRTPVRGDTRLERPTPGNPLTETTLIPSDWPEESNSQERNPASSARRLPAEML